LNHFFKIIVSLKKQFSFSSASKIEEQRRIWKSWEQYRKNAERLCAHHKLDTKQTILSIFSYSPTKRHCAMYKIKVYGYWLCRYGRRSSQLRGEVDAWDAPLLSSSSSVLVSKGVSWPLQHSIAVPDPI